MNIKPRVDNAVTWSWTENGLEITEWMRPKQKTITLSPFKVRKLAESIMTRDREGKPVLDVGEIIINQENITKCPYCDGPHDGLMCPYFHHHGETESKPEQSHHDNEDKGGEEINPHEPFLPPSPPSESEKTKIDTVHYYDSEYGGAICGATGSSDQMIYVAIQMTLVTCPDCLKDKRKFLKGA